jgi:hypothetical protein
LIAGSNKQTLIQFTDGDLKNAIAAATAAEGPGNPQAAMIVACFTFLDAQLAVLQPPENTAPSQDVGLATRFTLADLALSHVSAATSPALKAQYAVACGPLVVYVQNQGLALGNQIASLAALIAR